jgi:site-specific recombinase XerD
MIGIDDRGDGDAAVLSTSAEEFLTWLAVEKGRARNTVVAYRRDLLVYEAFLTSQGRTLDDADPGVVEDYVADRRLAGLRPPSVARAQAAVRGLHRFRQEEGFAVTDPTTDVRPPGPSRRLPKALSEEETEMLLEAAAGDDPAALRDTAMLEVLYGTGMRVSELAGLSLADLGSDTGLVRVLGKGSKERLVPLGSCASAALDDWLGPGGRPLFEPRRWARRGDAEAVFLNARGGRLTRQPISGSFRNSWGTFPSPPPRFTPRSRSAISGRPMTRPTRAPVVRPGSILFPCPTMPPPSITERCSRRNRGISGPSSKN